MIKGRELFESIFGKYHYIDYIIEIDTKNNIEKYNVYDVNEICIHVSPMHYYDQLLQKTIKEFPTFCDLARLTTNISYYENSKNDKIENNSVMMYYPTITELWVAITKRMMCITMQIDSYKKEWKKLRDLTKKYNFLIMDTSDNGKLIIFDDYQKVYNTIYNKKGELKL